MLDIRPETYKSPEQSYYLLSTTLFHAGLVEGDGNYLHVPTEHFGVARLTNYMSYEHQDYDSHKRQESLQRILAAGSPVLTIEFLDEAPVSYVVSDPRFVRPRSYIRQSFLKMAGKLIGAHSALYPRSNEDSPVFLSISRHDVKAVDPQTEPGLKEVIEGLPRAYQPRID